MSKIFILFFFLLTASCHFNLNQSSSAVLSSNVHVYVVPQGSKARVRTSLPTIFLKGGRQICRARPFRPKEVVSFLKNTPGLDTKYVEELFGLNEAEGSESSENSESIEQINSDPVMYDVGDNWLKFGLAIYNNNRDSSAFLIVDSISYIGTAQYKEQRFSVAGNIDAGYCSEGEGGVSAPYLYFLAPNLQVEYQPHSPNPFYNLTLFIDGFEIIDNSDLPSPGFGQAGGAESSGVERRFNRSEIIVIPNYTVHLTLRGSFVTNTGEPVAGFTKRVSFRTRSSF